MATPGELGNRIKSRRKALGISRPNLAKIAGVAYSTLAGIENGDQKTSTAEFLEAISKPLQCTVDWLVGKDGGSQGQNKLHDLLSKSELELVLAFRTSSVSEKKEILGFVAGISRRDTRSKTRRTQKTPGGIGEDSSSKKHKTV